MIAASGLSPLLGSSTKAWSLAASEYGSMISQRNRWDRFNAVKIRATRRSRISACVPAATWTNEIVIVALLSPVKSIRPMLGM